MSAKDRRILTDQAVFPNDMPPIYELIVGYVSTSPSNEQKRATYDGYRNAKPTLSELTIRRLLGYHGGISWKGSGLGG